MALTKSHQRLIQFIQNQGGYAWMKQIKDASFQSRDITKLVKERLLDKVKPGLYRLSNLESGLQDDVDIALLDTCQAIPLGVICLVSAAHYFGLIAKNPLSVYIAIPRGKKPPKIDHTAIQVYNVQPHLYESGMETIHTPNGDIRIYCQERTICDIFRFRNEIGEGTALEAMKNYLSQKKPNVDKILYYAEMCRIKNAILPYIKVIEGMKGL